MNLARYRAKSTTGEVFCNAYGPKHEEDYEARSIPELAHHIAYYWRRCSAMLEAFDIWKGEWTAALPCQQEWLSDLLDIAFTWNETH